MLMSLKAKGTFCFKNRPSEPSVKENVFKFTAMQNLSIKSATKLPNFANIHKKQVEKIKFIAHCTLITLVLLEIAQKSMLSVNTYISGKGHHEYSFIKKIVTSS